MTPTFCRLFGWKLDKLAKEREKREKTVIIKNLFDPSDFEVSQSAKIRRQNKIFRQNLRLALLALTFFDPSFPEMLCLCFYFCGRKKAVRDPKSECSRSISRFWEMAQKKMFLKPRDSLDTLRCSFWTLLSVCSWCQLLDILEHCLDRPKF